jgi:hypothetical protein
MKLYRRRVSEVLLHAPAALSHRTKFPAHIGRTLDELKIYSRISRKMPCIARKMPFICPKSNHDRPLFGQLLDREM